MHTIGDWGLGIGDWGLGIGPILNFESRVIENCYYTNFHLYISYKLVTKNKNKLNNALIIIISSKRYPRKI